MCVRVCVCMYVLHGSVYDLGFMLYVINQQRERFSKKDRLILLVFCFDGAGRWIFVYMCA